MDNKDKRLADEIERNRNRAARMQDAANRKSTSIQTKAAKGRRFKSQPSVRARYSKAGGGKRHFAVLRVRAIKDFATLSSADKHNNRRAGFEPPNADLSRNRLNRTLIGDKNKTIDDAVRERLAGFKLRKNGRIASELILSASPDFFKQPGALEAWTAENVNWIKQQFGAQVVSAELHLDEATPHIHVVLAHEPTGQLSYKQTFGGTRSTLNVLQSDYAASMSHLGIERGILKNEKMPEQTTSGWRRNVKKALSEAPKIPKKPNFERPSLIDKMTSGGRAKAAAWDNYDEKMQALAIWSEKNVPQLITRAAEAAHTQKRAEASILDVENMKSDYEKLKSETEMVRGLDLATVIEALGGTETKDSKASYRSRKFELNGEEIAVTEQLFTYQDKSRSGRGAIDLVIAISDCDYKSAVKTLIDTFGTSAATTAIVTKKVEEAKAEIKQLAAEKPDLPPPAAHKLQAGIEYLVKRGIPRDWCEKLSKEGVFYTDRNANLIFPRQNGGAFLRGTYSADPKKPNNFKRTIGAADAGAFVINGDKRKIALVEGPDLPRFFVPFILGIWPRLQRTFRPMT